jgi:hypothetical protein
LCYYLLQCFESKYIKKSLECFILNCIYWINETFYTNRHNWGIVCKPIYLPLENSKMLPFYCSLQVDAALVYAALYQIMAFHIQLGVNLVKTLQVPICHEYLC